MKTFTLSKSLVILGIFSFLLLSLGTNKLMLYSLDEAKNAECAREMFEHHNWIVPTFNDELRTDKPPLHYWVMMSSYHLFGVSEFSARLGSILAGVGTILLTFFFAWRNRNPRTAWITALVLLASLHIGVQFRMAVPDPYLIFFLTLAWVSFFEWYRKLDQSFQSSRWIWLMYLALGLGVLTKGPIALVLVGLSGGLFLFMRKELGYLLQMKLLPGIILILVLTLPWYLSVHQATGGAWTEGFFLKHNLSRFQAPMEGHGGFFLVTPLYVLIGLLPFSVFLPQAIYSAWKQRRQQEVLAFALSVAMVVVGFFSFSGTKLFNYTVPSYPFAAFLIGAFLDTVLEQESLWKSLRPSLIVYIVLAALLPIAFYLGLRLDPVVSHLAGWAFIFLTFPLGAAAAWYRFRHHQLNRTIMALTGSFIVTAILFFQLAYPIIDRENPVSQTIQLIGPEQKVIAYKQFNPAYVFYLNRPVEVMQTPEALQNALQVHPSVMVISRTEFLSELDEFEQLQEVIRKRDLFETPTTILLKKSPEY
ncbi:glycosyltransferase family 39 protein [Siphonobacter sp. SORGH_AS_1065]|uniref:ArnT family glycosyltransferase n=1 Tax=Siphonobacter sp. SORGH_AS_1065 TaxID=3041795 RepID=UPI002787A0E8|nr:glycosyltransferase family 39 protein [Siphonobacter sp. SORGH_AS_1065]MDQ1089411.1 4-amino-4-deoxy-L-arabinose transferase-like glycosyltransferase [Siphonobacter sp. SORGH_AS_1065]